VRGLCRLAARPPRQAEQLLDALEYLPIPRRTARQAGDWRRAYRAQGVQLATTDCLIAATAHAHGAQLVTRNLKHFPMPELTIVPLPQPPR
jgi:predicted nucleic acid-binding protein